jgi:hypothetical protein
LLAAANLEGEEYLGRTPGGEDEPAIFCCIFVRILT